MPELIEALRRGILMAGGLPMDFPTISIHESFSQPKHRRPNPEMVRHPDEVMSNGPLAAAFPNAPALAGLSGRRRLPLALCVRPRISSRSARLIDIVNDLVQLGKRMVVADKHLVRLS